MENAIMVMAALIGAGITMGLASIGAGIGDGLDRTERRTGRADSGSSSPDEYTSVV